MTESPPPKRKRRARRKKGRPSYKPNDKTRSQVEAMAGMGLLWEEIAQIVGVSVPTLRKYYLAELRAGTPKATARVAQSLFKQATDPNKPNVIAAIFWLKARAGWRDHEVEGRPGKKQLRADAAKDAANSSFKQRSTPTLVVDNTIKKA